MSARISFTQSFAVSKLKGFKPYIYPAQTKMEETNMQYTSITFILNLLLIYIQQWVLFEMFYNVIKLILNFNKHTKMQKFSPVSSGSSMLSMILCFLFSLIFLLAMLCNFVLASLTSSQERKFSDSLKSLTPPFIFRLLKFLFKNKIIQKFSSLVGHTLKIIYICIFSCKV